jgi:pyrroloquinoline quinone biosynthesis protein E
MAESTSGNGKTERAVKPPLAMLAELTHRCPLQCPYCSNPLELTRRSDELSTEEWNDVFRQAAGLGVLQVHLSGGEPTARKDLPALVAVAHLSGLYTNLITAGVLLTRDALFDLAGQGLDHVQLSIQDSEPANAERIGHFQGAHARKLTFAAWVREAGLPLTVNAVVHRQNLDHLEDIIALAHGLDAHRLEIAHVQYYGWALENRAALMPTSEQVGRADIVAQTAREALRGKMVIDYVVPDYHARRPKRCMDGWGSQFFAVTPRGRVLPCHAAETITGLNFSSVRERSLAWIWEHDETFNKFRGVEWMQEPCRSCEFRDRDLGGCRCQAFALTGDAAATDPVCEFSPHHEELATLAQADSRNGSGANSRTGEPRFIYRR